VLTEGATAIAADALAPLLAGRAKDRDRLLVALVGPPGAGKSTLAAHICEALTHFETRPALVVPMDGFHFDDRVLEARGLLTRKGAPETFDVDGLRVLLERVAIPHTEVAIPIFDRALEIARAGAAIVERRHRILIVEGNYLLLDEEPWSHLAGLFDLSIAIELPLVALERRLVQRWLDHGHDPDSALARARANDIPNARRVMAHSKPAAYRVFQTGEL
jgi:pantothenate kinase